MNPADNFNMSIENKTMISEEVLKKVRQIEIQTRKLVNEVFSGEYHSAFKGRGMEFAEVREYRYGDDIRQIDWNVTARSHDKVYMKVMEEERELTVYFLIDNSASGLFGSLKQAKSHIAAEICAVLAFSALNNGDKIGLLRFTDRTEAYLSPRKGKGYGLRLIREILFGENEGRGTDIGSAMRFLSRVARKRSVVFVVSDFYQLDFEMEMKALSSKHDVILIHTVDPFDREMPDLGLLNVEDAESGERALVDTGIASLRADYAEAYRQRLESLHRLSRRNKVDLVDIHTDESYITPLTRFFKRREQLMR